MGKRLTDEEREWRAISEKDFQTKVMKLAREHGWEVAHFHNSQKMVRRGNRYVMVGDPDARGFPDLVSVRGAEILFWELKKELGQPTEHQERWLAVLQAGGFEARVVKPSDFESYVIPRLTGG